MSDTLDKISDLLAQLREKLTPDQEASDRFRGIADKIGLLRGIQEIKKRQSALDDLRVELLGKAGVITAQLKSLGKLPPDQRKSVGEFVNRAKQQIESAVADFKTSLDEAAFEKRLAEERIDVTLPGRDADLGSIHPITRTLDRIGEIFARLATCRPTVPKSKTTTTTSKR